MPTPLSSAPPRQDHLTLEQARGGPERGSRDHRENDTDAEREPRPEHDDAGELTQEQPQDRNDQDRGELLCGPWIVHPRRQDDDERDSNDREQRRVDEHCEDPAGRHDDLANVVGHRERQDADAEHRRGGDGDRKRGNHRGEDLPEQQLPRADRRRENRLKGALAFLADDRVRREHRGNEDWEEQKEDRELSPDDRLGDLERRERCELRRKGSSLGYGARELPYREESNDGEDGHDRRQEERRHQQSALKPQFEPLLLEDDERLLHAWP